MDLFIKICWIFMFICGCIGWFGCVILIKGIWMLGFFWVCCWLIIFLNWVYEVLFGFLNVLGVFVYLG